MPLPASKHKEIEMVFAVASTISIIYKHHVENLHRMMQLLPASNFNDAASSPSMLRIKQGEKTSFFSFKAGAAGTFDGSSHPWRHAKSVVEKPFLHPHFFCFASRRVKPHL
jgi:hypothetical protein